MRTTSLFALASAVVLVTACTQQEQQAVTDTLTAESSSSIEETVFEFSSASSEAASSVFTQEYIGSDASVQGHVDTQAHTSAAESSVAPAKAKGSYVAYNASALQDGHVKVLFFHAGWCPLCKGADTSLKGWYGSDSTRPEVTVYKVDYDTETDLKAQYGVTYQHTFVKVDGQGKMIGKIQTPNENVLKEFLGV